MELTASPQPRPSYDIIVKFADDTDEREYAGFPTVRAARAHLDTFIGHMVEWWSIVDADGEPVTDNLTEGQVRPSRR